MVCLPLSDTEAPLERLAGWRLVFFVILEFSLCLLFSLHQPPSTSHTHKHKERLDDYYPFLRVYSHSSWVQDLLPDLSEEQRKTDFTEWKPHAELYSLLDSTLHEHLSPAPEEERLFTRRVLAAES
ncbi:hypothetical protein Emed_000336 [Eimeria media]